MSAITSGGIININVTEKVKAAVKELTCFNPLNAELNPICHLLALLGAHPILHISRIRVKEVTGWQLLADHRLFSLYRHFFEAHVRITNRL
jgi:hypothetical protein